MNQTVLMSGADVFGVEELNPYSDRSVQPDVAAAVAEHAAIRDALESAGVKVVQVDAPESCQDGVYTANWAMVRGDKAVLSSLPKQRQAETPFAEKYLRGLGKQIIQPPYRFSGQGDALPCGNLLFAGSQYRTDPRMHQFLADELGYEVISLQAMPELDASGQPVTNAVTGWPDSFFYDIDLAISILRWPSASTLGLIAWCPEAFTPESQEKLRALDKVEKIEVSLSEAQTGFACNLVSTGQTVVMSARAPQLQKAIEASGLKTITPTITELAKGGGYIRCTTLTLDNA
jgi:N-dimethylarginine dimethylaminohydrolase